MKAILIGIFVAVTTFIGFWGVVEISLALVRDSVIAAQQEASFMVDSAMRDIALRLIIMSLAGLVLVYVAIGFALKFFAPYERSDLLWGAIGGILILSIISPAVEEIDLILSGLSLLMRIGLGGGIIYGIGQFWVEGDGKMHPRYLGVIRAEDGSMSQVKWLPMTGKITLHSPKTRYVEELGTVSSHQEALAFFNQLRAQKPVESQPSSDTQE